MSVWLLRRPHSLARINPVLFSSRSVHYAGRSNLQIANADHRRWLPHPHSLVTLDSRRWQSTKETPSPEAHVPAEAKQTSVSTPNDDSPKPPVLTRAWKKVKHEAQHYWNGSKLLVSEVRISGRLQWKILQGETLTRRERRQVRKFCLCRTCISRLRCS